MGAERFVHYLQGERLACGDTHSVFASPRLEAVTCPQCRTRQQHWPEAELLRAVREAAKGAGYLLYHTHRSDRSDKGFPDTVIAKPGKAVIFAELKTAKGKLTMEQQMWHDCLMQATGIATHVWRPADLPLIPHLLRT